MNAVVALCIAVLATWHGPDDLADLQRVIEQNRPTTGGFRAHYVGVQAPDYHIFIGWDCQTGAWYHISRGYVEGIDASGRFFGGREFKGGVAYKPGKSPPCSPQDELLPSMALACILAKREAISSIERTSDEGFLFSVTRPAVRDLTGTLNVPTVTDEYLLDGSGRTKQRISLKGSDRERAFPVTYYADAPPRIPIVQECAGWRLVSCESFADSRPELFDMSAVEEVAVDANTGNRVWTLQPAAPPGPAPLGINTAGADSDRRNRRALIVAGIAVVLIGAVAWIRRRR